MQSELKGLHIIQSNVPLLRLDIHHKTQKGQNKQPYQKGALIKGCSMFDRLKLIKLMYVHTHT